LPFKHQNVLLILLHIWQSMSHQHTVCSTGFVRSTGCAPGLLWLSATPRGGSVSLPLSWLLWTALPHSARRMILFARRRLVNRRVRHALSCAVNRVVTGSKPLDLAEAASAVGFGRRHGLLAMLVIDKWLRNGKAHGCFVSGSLSLPLSDALG
jgi:hypothetical protein